MVGRGWRHAEAMCRHKEVVTRGTTCTDLLRTVLLDKNLRFFVLWPSHNTSIALVPLRASERWHIMRRHTFYSLCASIPPKLPMKPPNCSLPPSPSHLSDPQSPGTCVSMATLVSLQSDCACLTCTASEDESVFTHRQCPMLRRAHFSVLWCPSVRCVAGLLIL